MILEHICIILGAAALARGVIRIVEILEGENK